MKWTGLFSKIFGSKSKSNKILIIDETYVLFDMNYFGNTYALAVPLKKESVRRLLEFVWKNR